MTQDPLPTTAGEQNTSSPPSEPMTANPSPGKSARAASRPTADQAFIRRKIISGAVAAAVGGVTLAVGVAHISWGWLLPLGADLTLIGFFVTEALMADMNTKAVWWRSGLIFTLVLLAGIVIYHERFDPATHAAPTYSLSVNGSEAAAIDLYGEPDPGSVQLLATGELKQNGLIGGQTYGFFECSTFGTDGREWLRYRRYGRVWWAPRSYLHAPLGTPDPTIPRC